jgi:hypothetical protein
MIKHFTLTDMTNGDIFTPTFENHGGIWFLSGFCSPTNSPYYPPEGALWDFDVVSSEEFIASPVDGGGTHIFHRT